MTATEFNKTSIKDKYINNQTLDLFPNISWTDKTNNGW